MTRHLDVTLKRDDWDVLILHYLGLDHIGHTSGPHSSLIQPKLLEMDDILKKIHASLISKVLFHPPSTPDCLSECVCLCVSNLVVKQHSHKHKLLFIYYSLCLKL